MNRRLTAIAAITAATARWASAAPPAAGAVETRVFDVRDLIYVAPDHPLGGALVPPTRISVVSQQAQAAAAQAGTNTNVQQSGDGQGKPPVTPVGRIEQIVEATVDPASWRDAGGDRGAINATDEGLLFVTQSAESLQKVATVLDQLRAGRSGMIRVRADWVLLAPGDVRQLLRPDSAAQAMPEVDRAALDKAKHLTATVSCMNGQTVHVTSGPAQTVITAATPVVAPQATAFDVQQTLVQYGLALQVTALAGGGKTATLDLTSIASRPTGAPPPVGGTTRPAVAGETAVPIGIDRFAAMVHSLQTTVQVPVGRPVLVGGMTLDAASTTSDGDRELYLIVEADVGT